MNAPATAFTLQPNTVMQVPIAALCRDPGNREISTESIKAMAEDIGARGIELPIVVRSDFVIKDGERRWRAAQLAGLETVPCILAGPAAEQNGAVEWRLDQVADNHHREPLNALDWARVLRELVDVHQMAVKDIPALLKARGIEMSRPYISNLIRLNELPEWAKALIASGVLPPGAGKYVLMAASHAPAMAKLREGLENEAKRLQPGQSLRADINWQVRRAFVAATTELSNNYGENKPRFPWASSCKDCTTRGQVEGEHFCFDRPCYDNKQAAADAAKKTEPKKGKTSTAKPKADPRAALAAAQATRQREVRDRVNNQVIALIAKKAEAGLSHQDRRLIALQLLDEIDAKPILERRGWPTPKDFSAFEAGKIAARELVKLNPRALDGFILECALHSQNYPGSKVVTDTAKRYRIDIKALQKAELAKLKPAANPKGGKTKS